MKTLESLKAKHHKEIADLETKNAIIATLPVKPTLVCLHRDHASAVYSKQFPHRYSFQEAVEIMSHYPRMVVSEHWKNGCQSVRPLSINKIATEDRATKLNESTVEIVITAGKGYESHALCFWTEVSGRLIQVSIDLQPKAGWLPVTEFRYDIHGNCTKSRVIPSGIGEDFQTKWWSPDGSYRISYYWRTMASFESLK